MSISFEVFAKDTVYRCLIKRGDLIADRVTLKVEDPFFDERKLFIRKEGGWEQLCTNYGDVITDDSFKCFRPESPENTSFPRDYYLSRYYDFLIFDEVISNLIGEYSYTRRDTNTRDKGDRTYICTKSE